MSIVVKILGLLTGACVGVAAAYYPAAVVACDWLWPTANLCGLPVALFVAPAGLAFGAVAGWRIAGGLDHPR